MSIETLQVELEEEIRRISDAVKRLDDSRLSERVILLLIQDAGGCKGYPTSRKLTVKMIRRVLDAVRRLPEHCFKEEEA